MITALITGIQIASQIMHLKASLKVHLKIMSRCKVYIMITNVPIKIKATLRWTVTARGKTGHANESK